ncbi:MAG: hypothetical protein JSV33_12345 [bacterium]|nr:MAG: hypothetical protein JSV33_12345 [bacterium]
MDVERYDTVGAAGCAVRQCLRAALLLACILAGCGGTGRFVPPPPFPDDREDIPEPSVREYHITADLFDKQFTEQIEQTFDFSRQARNLFGKRKEAFNVDAFDEVPNSSWFTNRNARRRMTIEEIARGPDVTGGPDPSTPWVITRAKSEGVTPGFHIKDGNGNRYLIKFDPRGYSELVTGAEVISTKIFYAAGYHVPGNYIVYFDPAILRLGEDVKFTDEKGRKRLMTNGDLKSILDSLEILPDGRIRALASKYIPGIPKGPFKYHGVRKDDPNDIVPHQHRRELRGLRVIAAWLNHVDTKSGNSFDSYVTVGDKSYLRHYLIDFGSTLGSAAHGPMKPKTGHENQVDPHEILLNIITLGLYVRSYEKMEGVRYPSVGLYESELFDPGGFKFSVPNPAFESCTALDGFWGAKIVMSFTDEQLETAVAQGLYSDPEAAHYILRVLKERRDKTGRHWFSKVNPLDRFELVESVDGGQRICFVDLAVDGGLESAAQTRYRYDLRIGGRLVVEGREVRTGTCIELPDRAEQKDLVRKVSDDTQEGEQWEIRIQTRRTSKGRWSRWIKVFLSVGEETGGFGLLGIDRQH